MKVLVACEWSNTVRDAFLAKGHDAYSCDLERAEYPNPNFRRHIRGDVRPLLKEKWDLVIAHPPCTYLSNARINKRCTGYKHLLKDAVQFFIECLNANSPKICIENPRQHIYAKTMIDCKHSQEIHPWMFGDPYSKLTCLWLKGLPKLKPTNIVSKGKRDKSGMPLWYNRSSKKERSRTFLGIAQAMADQWTNWFIKYG